MAPGAWSAISLASPCIPIVSENLRKKERESEALWLTCCVISIPTAFHKGPYHWYRSGLQKLEKTKRSQYKLFTNMKLFFFFNGGLMSIKRRAPPHLLSLSNVCARFVNLQWSLNRRVHVSKLASRNVSWLWSTSVYQLTLMKMPQDAAIYYQS